ncbi:MULTISPECIES: hypothetical protein [Streptomyces]|uniref:hypothetical protein n=1 Tax=Streptomyces TaxID=1883 RepID=UPI001D0A4412|nr:hypothetical protein [Streptomyces longhuiensis]UDM04809.1 hypothetical protein LGI35_44645 [Streptomyces longhuiensis]
MGQREQRVNGLFDELGRKIANKWLTTLLIPGLLWVCTALLAWQLGWRHALDPHSALPLFRRLDPGHLAGKTVMLAVSALIAAVGAGIAADGLSTPLRSFWTAPVHSAPSRWLRNVRRERWERANRNIEAVSERALRTGDGSEIDAAWARRDAISPINPVHATWIGDRLRENQRRVQRAYGLDLATTWPRLWAVVPDPIRADIAVAQENFANAARIVAWALLYGLVGLLWGPALLIAVGVLYVGARRARSATEVLCQLVESCVDLYAADLAERLRIPCAGVFSRAVGELISELLRKDRA